MRWMQEGKNIGRYYLYQPDGADGSSGCFLPCTDKIKGCIS